MGRRESHEMTEQQFLMELYDRLKVWEEQWPRQPKRLPSRDKLHPASPRFQESWHWEVNGSRESWWLTIVDPRYPGPEYPWRVMPKGDPAFFPVAREQAHLIRNIDTFIDVVLVTRMEEFDLGHTNAEAAYNQGATSSDPPWVSTTIQ